jgi:drug/metabolite transporter (DMT)-like permease
VTPASPRPSPLPALALVANAAVWGTSWWPMRQLEGAGVHALWTTALAFALAVVAIALVRPRAPGQLLARPGLWVLVLASGATNAAFNWGVTIGDVVRVVLLFYLMPVWAVILARLLLGERLTRASALRIALGIVGAVIVLWPVGEAAAAGARSTLLPDALAVVGGFTFALNNVMLRRHAKEPAEARALAMFVGGALVAGAIAALLGARGIAPFPPPPAAGWLAGIAGMAVLFLLGNLALQYGASRLPAQVTAVVMLTEIVFASVSAVLLGGGSGSARLAAGGALIVAGAVLAAVDGRGRR